MDRILLIREKEREHSGEDTVNELIKLHWEVETKDITSLEDTELQIEAIAKEAKDIPTIVYRPDWPNESYYRAVEVAESLAKYAPNKGFIDLIGSDHPDAMPKGKEGVELVKDVIMASKGPPYTIDVILKGKSGGYTSLKKHVN